MTSSKHNDMYRGIERSNCLEARQKWWLKTVRIGGDVFEAFCPSGDDGDEL